MKNKIISIQSKLIYGYVGSNIAELAIQLHGLDVIAFPSVLLSAHTGHQPSHGTAISKELFEDLILGIEALDILNSTFGIITGYIGTEDILSLTSHYIEQIKNEYPDKLYICDPVMGDISTDLYVSKNVADKLLTTLIPLCDILTPNHFELEYILKAKVNSTDEILELVNKDPILKEKTIVITSCILKETLSNQLDIVIVENNSAKRITCKKIDIETTGTGDLFTALLVSRLTKGESVLSATTEASTIISKTLNYVLEKGYKEMNAECLLKFVR